MVPFDNDLSDLLAAPDPHLDPRVAATYDQSIGDRASGDQVEPVVELLSELAGPGPAVEFAIGTGRIALPLSEDGVEVHGMDLSEPMLTQLRRKAGAERLHLHSGDMTSARVCDEASLVYLVFNTIMNLRTQTLQCACFANAAAHLASGGRFLIECQVPQIHRLPPGETIRPFEVTSRHLGFDQYIDLANQISVSHHYYFDGDRARVVSAPFRYVWPSELDLMAQMAGMELESRWSGWDRAPFTGHSVSHVSVWRRV